MREKKSQQIKTRGETSTWHSLAAASICCTNILQVNCIWNYRGQQTTISSCTFHALKEPNYSDRKISWSLAVAYISIGKYNEFNSNQNDIQKRITNICDHQYNLTTLSAALLIQLPITDHQRVILEPISLMDQLTS